MGQKVLVVDDEKLIVKGIRFSLEQDGIILLDVMLPKLTGFEVCQQVREFSNVPVVMLTAKGDDMDKILGLEYGADDYITKPFNILEVKARIKAIMRRMRKKAPEKEVRRVVDCGCSHPEAARENRAESKRTKVCTYKMGSRILFQCISGI